MKQRPRPPPAETGDGIEDAMREAASRSREVIILRDRLRRMLDRPDTAEAFARAVRGWLRRD